MSKKRNNSEDQLLQKFVIALLPRAGDVLVRRLISHLGGVDELFNAKKTELVKVPGIGEIIANQVYNALRNKELLERAQKELIFTEKYNIKTYFYLDADYPIRLSQCEDAPVLFFCKGDIDLNAAKMISVVGTRKSTNYGRNQTQKIITDLAENHKDLVIVSGLAFGIDVIAHQTALDTGLKTVAVTAHGMDMVYPAEHRNIAEQIIKQGCIITEFFSGQQPDRQNFVKRNRIVAGMADATLVIEAGLRSGALITADIANSYNKDVLAIPGKIGDSKSTGPNFLIKSNRAALIESAFDIEKYLNWDIKGKNVPKQLELFSQLSGDEKIVFDLLEKEGNCNIDFISRETHFSISKLSSILLNMEFQGVLECLPGKIYAICR